MNHLIALYWRPVFCFIHSRNHSRDQAADLAQGFFLRFLEKGWIAKYDNAKGKFRTYLLTLLKRFLADQGPERACRQTLFERGILCIEALAAEDDRMLDPSSDEPPERAFDRQWAHQSLRRTLDDVRHHCIKDGREQWFEIFIAVRYPQDNEPPTQDALATQFRLSRDQIRYAVEKVDELFRMFFDAEVRSTLPRSASAEDVTDEICQLESLLARNHSV